MERRLRHIGAVLILSGGFSLIYTLTSARENASALLLPGFYFIVAGFTLYGLAPRLARRWSGSLERAKATPPLAPKRRRAKVQLLFLAVVSLGVAVAEGWSSARPFLWPLQSLVILALAGLGAGFILYRVLAAAAPDLAPAPGPGALPKAIPLVGGLAVLVAVGLIISNSYLDFSPARGVLVPVAAKYSTTSRNHTRRWAKLGPVLGGGFAGLTEETVLKAPEAAFPLIREGESRVRVKIRHGLWRLPWVESADFENLTPEPSAQESAEAARRLINEARRKKNLPPRP